MRVIPSGFIFCLLVATEITEATLSGKAQYIHGCKDRPVQPAVGDPASAGGLD